jgi:hypothetical protein
VNAPPLASSFFTGYVNYRIGGSNDANALFTPTAETESKTASRATANVIDILVVIIAFRFPFSYPS